MGYWFEVAHDVIDEDGTVLGVVVDHRERGNRCWYAEDREGRFIGYAGTRAAASALVTAKADGRPILQLH